MDSVERKVKALATRIQRDGLIDEPVQLELTPGEVRALAAFISLWHSR
jgi:hypothetical protein